MAPICLYSGESSDELLTSTLSTIGWGKTSPSGLGSPDLQKAQINYVPHRRCQEAYSQISKDILPHGIMQESQICAGTEDGSKDTCQVSLLQYMRISHVLDVMEIFCNFNKLNVYLL